MSPYLLDANVLIALAWPEHTAHARVGRWFARHARAGWATCPITESAFVRVLSNPAFSSNSLTPENALIVLKRSAELPGHLFWGDTIPLAKALTCLSVRLRRHQQITDAYLVGLALHNDGRLATMDSGIPHLTTANAVELIP